MRLRRNFRNLGLSEKILNQKERILAEYNAWNQLIDPNGLGQPAFEAFNDLFSNIEFHEKRDGKFTLFHRLPNEIKFMVIKKASDMPPTSVDSTGRTFNVLYGNITEEDQDYDYDLFIMTSGKKGVEKGESSAQARRRRHEMENALDYY
uniref:FACT complex subunit n=1 Tax=Bursaphelenchus xylophilus TaxID=6326 RepID=A0A1I7SJN9_BURXY